MVCDSWITNQFVDPTNPKFVKLPKYNFKVISTGDICWYIYLELNQWVWMMNNQNSINYVAVHCNQKLWIFSSWNSLFLNPNSCICIFKTSIVFQVSLYIQTIQVVSIKVFFKAFTCIFIECETSEQFFGDRSG